MALILSDDQRTIVLADKGPLTRAKLLADYAFCENMAEISAYIDSLKWARQTTFFRNGYIAHQFNTSMQELCPTADPPFDIDVWYKNNCSAESETAKQAKNFVNGSGSAPPSNDTLRGDWITALMNMELEVGGGFVKALRNCIEMEDRIRENMGARLRSFITSNGSSRGGGFFSGGIGGGMNPL